MNSDDNRELVERYWQAAAARDLDTVYELRHEDFVGMWPQSGERIVGRDNARAIDENYPNWPDVQTRQVWGSGEIWVVESTLAYGDDVYYAVDILELRENKVVAETAYWGAPFEAAEWRAQWVERVDPSAS